MKSKVTRTTYRVDIEDAEPVTGLTSGMRKATVIPVWGEIKVDHGPGGGVSFDLLGPKVREDGSLTAAHFSVCLDTRGGLSIEPPVWLLDLIEQVTR